MYQNIGNKVPRAVCLHSSWPRPVSKHASSRHAPCVVEKVSVNKLYLSVKDPWQPLVSSRHAVALTVNSMSQWTIFSHSHYIRKRKDPVICQERRRINSGSKSVRLESGLYRRNTNTFIALALFHLPSFWIWRKYGTNAEQGAAWYRGINRSLS